MITIEEYLAAIQYKITTGSEYQWNCYGDQVQSIDCEANGDYSIIAMVDREDQTVYEVQAWDYIENRFYRWIDPLYLLANQDEHAERGLSFEAAGDTQTFVNLEEAEDMLEKVAAIVAGEEYDRRMIVKLNLTDEDELMIHRSAHEADMSFNEFVNDILRKHMEALQNELVQDTEF